MDDKEITERLKKAKSGLSYHLEYLANSLIKEFEDNGHLIEFSRETANDLIGRVK